MRQSTTPEPTAPEESRFTRRGFFGLAAAAPIVAPEIVKEIRSQWFSLRFSRYLKFTKAAPREDGGFIVPKEFAEALKMGAGGQGGGLRRIPIGPSSKAFERTQPLSVLDQMIEHDIFDIDVDAERAIV